MNWQELIDSESNKDYFVKLSSFVNDERAKYNVYPSSNNVFNALTLCPLDKIKTVIIAQDPYHGANQAHGLAFSVQKGIKIPPSLKNIFKEINSDLGLNINPLHGDLTSWAEQGVLLLNTVLTVRDGEPASHKNKGWEVFTDKVIKLINEQNRPIVFLLWGGFALSKKPLLNNTKHLILEAAHPSGLSAHKGFFGCKHFSKTNNFLNKNNITQINWNNQE